MCGSFAAFRGKAAAENAAGQRTLEPECSVLRWNEMGASDCAFKHCLVHNVVGPLIGVAAGRRPATACSWKKLDLPGRGRGLDVAGFGRRDDAYVERPHLF